MKKSALILLLASSLMISGCELTSAQDKNANYNSENSYSASNEEINSENTDNGSKAISNSEEPKYRREYDENGSLYLVNNKSDDVITPFPEGWSGERISKMVTIDGYQLTLPCKVSDILELSEDFRAEEPFDYGDGTSSFQIWYKDVIAVSGIYNNDTEIMQLINIGANKYVKFEGIDSTKPDDLFTLFNSFSKNFTGSIDSSYIDSDIVYHIDYTGSSTYTGVSLCWEEI